MFIKRLSDLLVLFEFELIIDGSLGFIIKVYGCLLFEDYELYLNC